MERLRFIYEGDNLAVLRSLPEASFDLVYLDPPFGSKKVYQAVDRISGCKTSGGFSDRWKWDKEAAAALDELRTHPDSARFFDGMLSILGQSPMAAYLVFIAIRLIELRRLLKSSGSLYLHCDQRASSHLRLLLDSIFGEDCFLGTVVWCYGLGGSSARRWPHKHDDIIWFARIAGKHYFSPWRQPATSLRMKGKLKKSPDYWLIPSLNNMSRERTGYPTQKPEALLERIICSSSPPDSVVLDPFCGSGTTLAAAEKNGRSWVGIDSDPVAVAISQKRLESIIGIDSITRIRIWEP